MTRGRIDRQNGGEDGTMQQRLLTWTRWLFAITAMLLIATGALVWITYVYSHAAYKANQEVINAETSISIAIQDLPQIKTVLNDVGANSKSTKDNLESVNSKLDKLQTTYDEYLSYVRLTHKLDTIRHKIDYFENSAIPELERFNQLRDSRNVRADSTRQNLNSVLYWYYQAEDGLYKKNYPETERWITVAETQYQILVDDYKNKIKDYLSYPIVE